MLKKLQFLMLFLAIGLVSFGQGKGTIIGEDFEAYTAGGHLAEQAVAMGIDYWTTWDNAPGSATDPMVSSDVAHGGSNSVVIASGNDCVLLLGDLTAGKYSMGFYVYIPDGYFGYFNLLQDFAGSNSQWGMQAYFDAGGLGTVDAGGQGAGTFNYSYDTWIYVQIIVDLDEDMAQMYVDNNMVVEWQWSTGTFGTGTLNQLSAMNLYAWDVNGEPMAYYDDVNFEQITSAEISEDFEMYTSGEQLVLEAQANGIDYWTTWDNAPGSPTDPYISSDQASSGSNSVVIEGLNDAVMLLGNKTSGAYDIDMKVFQPSGYFGYFNVLQDFAGANSQWGMQVYFDAGGLGTVDAGGQGAGVFNYNYDEWIDLKISVDLNNDFAEFFVNGSSVVTWVWSSGTFGTGTLNQLSAIDFYAWDVNGTPKTYYDDVVFTMTAPPGGEPEIVVSPTSLTFDLEQNQTGDDDFSITNIGVADLEYNIAVMYTALMGNNTITAQRSTGEAASLKSEIILNPADLSMDMNYQPGEPYENTDDEVILNYDGENNDAIGLTSGGTFQVAAMFPASMVGQYTGMQLTEIQIYINDDPDDLTLKVYGQGSPNAPGSLLYEQAYVPTPTSWNYITLDTPVTISGGDIWVGYEVTHQAGLFPAGTDAGPADPNGDWISTGGSWDHLAGFGLDYNWNVRAKLVGEPISQWLSVTPTSGTVAPNDMDEITVTANSADLEEGTYTADIVITSNDPDNPTVIVSVTLNVGGGGPTPVILAELTFEEQEDWSLTFDPWTALDVDGGNTYSINGYTFPGQNEPMAYIAFNPATVDPPMTEPEIQPYAGERFGACFASVPPPTNDDWIISPLVELGVNSEFNFWAKSYTDQYGLEKFNVGVSTSGMAPEDFDILNASVLEAPTEWTLQTFDLSAYDGQQVYVAIQCVSEDAFIFMIDDLEVTSLPSGIEENEMANLSIYPNPANNVVNINSDEEIMNVRIVNYTGQIVYDSPVNGQSASINISDLPAGVYVIQTQTQSGWASSKLMVQ